MKRKLSLLLALVMILSLVPMSAFATTTNNVTRVVTVGKDDNLANLTSNYPVLRIENKDRTLGSKEIFRLTVSEDAEWHSSIFGVNLVGQPASRSVSMTPAAFGWEEAAAGSFELVTRKINDRTVEVEVYNANNAKFDKDFALLVPMAVELDGAKGEQTVTIERRDSAVSAGTYTFAIAESGATVATVGSKVTMGRETKQVAPITIDETKAGSLSGPQEFRLRLPRDFEWGNVTISAVRLGVTPADFQITPSSDKRDLTVSFAAISSFGDARGSITIDAAITPNKDAAYGDVKVSLTKLRGDMSNASELVVASYKDYGIEVSLKDKEVKEFLAGRVETGEYVTAEVKIKETIAGSLLPGRIIDFELPSWVMLTSNESFGIETNFSADATVIGDGKTHKWEYSVPSGAYNGKREITMEIPLTVKGNQTGDIDLKIKGAGIDETITVAKAVAPITAEVKMADVKLGVQKQAAPDIIIKETKAGAIEKGNLELWFVDNYGFRFDDAKFEVIEGDLEIDQTPSGVKDRGSNSKNMLRVVVKSESEKPATVKISGITVTLDRNVPEGPFNLDIGGDALVDNAAYDDFTSRVARFAFANVITPAPGAVKATVKFAIDNTTYSVVQNGVEVEKTMDVAPYIKDSRTFLSVRYVAEALGVAENAIVWNANTKTVTVKKDANLAQMTVGSKNLIVNGMNIVMDTAVENKDGRVMLPIAHLAMALGVSYEWDGTARTVTFME